MENELFTMFQTFITSVGFPITCVVFLWKYINTTLKELIDVINKNTNIIAQLSSYLSKKDGD